MVVFQHPKYHPERKIQVPSVDLTGCASLRFPSLSLPYTFVSVCYFCLLRGFCVEFHVLLVPFLQVGIPQSKVICLVKQWGLYLWRVDDATWKDQSKHWSSEARQETWVAGDLGKIPWYLRMLAVHWLVKKFSNQWICSVHMIMHDIWIFHWSFHFSHWAMFIDNVHQYHMRILI